MASKMILHICSTSGHWPSDLRLQLALRRKENDSVTETAVNTTALCYSCRCRSNAMLIQRCDRLWRHGRMHFRGEPVSDIPPYDFLSLTTCLTNEQLSHNREGCALLGDRCTTHSSMTNIVSSFLPSLFLTAFTACGIPLRTFLSSLRLKVLLRMHPRPSSDYVSRVSMAIC